MLTTLQGNRGALLSHQQKPLWELRSAATQRVLLYDQQYHQQWNYQRPGVYVRNSAGLQRHRVRCATKLHSSRRSWKWQQPIARKEDKPCHVCAMLTLHTTPVDFVTGSFFMSLQGVSLRCLLL